MADAAALALKERVVARELTWAQVELAAYVDDPVAAAACAAAYPPRALPLASGKPASLLSRVWRALRRSPAPHPLAAWASVLERYGASLHVRAAVAAVRVVLPAWEEAYPARTEPRRALDLAQAWAAAPSPETLMLARAAASAARAFRPVGPAPAPAAAALAADVCDLTLGAAGSVHPDLGDLVVACMAVWVAWSVRRAGEAARAESIAAKKDDYEGWRAARAAAEAVGRRAVAGEAERAIRAGLSAALVPWLLGPSSAAVLVEEPEAQVAERRAIRGKRARRRHELVSHGAPAAPAPSDPLGDLGWAVAAKVAAHALGGPVFALLLAEYEEQRAPKRPVGPEDPDALWDCPRCASLTRNSSPVCIGCGYRVA